LRQAAVITTVALALSACNRAGDPRADQPDAGRQLTAVVEMGESGDPKFVGRLIEIVQAADSAPQVRMEAIYALARLGDRRAVLPLMALLEHDMTHREGYAMAAIPALGMLGDERAAGLLREALNDRAEDWLGRAMAARALGQIGARDAVPDLLQAAWQGDTREAAIEALASLEDPRAVAVLFSALGDEEAADTREGAEQALVRIGTPTVMFISRQLDGSFVDFPDQTYRLAARRLLRQIDTDQARTLLAVIDGTPEDLN
jgi:HEAT repeat protein